MDYQLIIASISSYAVGCALNWSSAYLLEIKQKKLIGEILMYFSIPFYFFGFVGVFTIGPTAELNGKRIYLQEREWKIKATSNVKMLTAALYHGTDYTRLKALAKVDPDAHAELESLEESLSKKRAEIDSILSSYASDEFPLYKLHVLLCRSVSQKKDFLPDVIPKKDKLRLEDLQRYLYSYQDVQFDSGYDEQNSYCKRILEFIGDPHKPFSYIEDYNPPHKELPLERFLKYRIPFPVKIILYPLLLIILISAVILFFYPLFKS